MYASISKLYSGLYWVVLFCNFELAIKVKNLFTWFSHCWVENMCFSYFGKRYLFLETYFSKHQHSGFLGWYQTSTSLFLERHLFHKREILKNRKKSSNFSCTPYSVSWRLRNDLNKIHIEALKVVLTRCLRRQRKTNFMAFKQLTMLITMKCLTQLNYEKEEKINTVIYIIYRSWMGVLQANLANT